ncbi:MAG: M23 family metallopeptidase [Burkholderiaceae bacterium]|nr:M23 family metallopeptidase [Burkholderiaceae bacterium]
MSAPSILAKNLRSVGKALLWLSRTALEQWKRLIHSPYRRICLGAAFSLLPISVSIAAFSLAPDDVEKNLRASQKLVETSVPMPAIAEQINVVTTHRLVATHTTYLRRSDTLSSIFARLDINDTPAQRFLRQQTLAQVLVAPRDGIYVQAKVSADNKMQSMRIFMESRSADREDTVVNIVKRGKGFTINSAPFRYETQQGMATGIIKTTLEDGAREHGVPEKVIEQFPMAFERFFSRGNKLQAGDSFRLIYERKLLDGEFVRTGKVLAMAITHNGQTHESFWAEDGTRDGGYYKLDGTTNQLAFIRVPVEGARVTSSFMPMRRHPVTGVLRPHQGTDFGAPKGNKIYAAADGVVTRRRFNEGGFGYYIMITHDDSRVSLYAHMSKIMPHIQVGTRVRRGEVVGLVGATGLATGPHLHYELRVNDRQVNPLKTPIPDKEELTTEELEDLLANARVLTARLALLNRLQTAQPQAADTQEAAAVQLTSETTPAPSKKKKKGS